MCYIFCMEIYKNAWFKKFARKQKITNSVLKRTIEDIENGMIDVDLGGNVIKQRIARPNQGKSGGYRTIIIFKKGDKSFFVYGFAKSQRNNIEEDELKVFKEMAKTILSLSDKEIEKAINDNLFTEVI